MAALIEEKRNLLKEVLLSLTDELGENVGLKFKTTENVHKLTIASDNDELNKLLNGGFTVGRILELYGVEGVGKTSFALKLSAKVQANGGLAAIVDVEHTFNRVYARTLGIDESRLWVAEPNSAEEALTIFEKLIRSKLFEIVILDSVAALSPEIETEAEEGLSGEWLQASILSQALRRIVKLLRETKTLVVFINQLRSRPTVCHFEGETTPGGMALKFFADYRLKLCLGDDDFVLAKAPKF